MPGYEITSAKDLFFKYDQRGPLGPYDVDFGSLGPPPHSLEVQKKCDRYFLITWTFELTDQEAELVPRWPDLPDSGLLRSMNDKLDEEIMLATFFVGKPFIDYCLVYQRRMFDWQKEPNGPNLFAEYGKMLERRTRFLQSEPYEYCDITDDNVKAPLQDPGLYRFREQLFVEWGMMLARIRKSGLRIASEICPLIKRESDNEPAVFPVIRARFSNVQEFICYSESEGNLDYVLRRWRPRQFVKQFLSYGTGREATSLAHYIGRMGKALIRKP